MQDLEGCAATMVWDWDANDINADEDDGRQWVLVTLQTMRHIETLRDIQIESPMPHTTPSHQMWVYVLQLSRDGQAEQVSMPSVIPVHMPQVCGDLVINKNLGKGSR